MPIIKDPPWMRRLEKFCDFMQGLTLFLGGVVLGTFLKS